MRYSLKEQLDILRKNRNFNVDDYIEKKSKAINTFFKENGLDAAVVGVSGGVDSAVTIMLLDHASKEPNSPIKTIIGIIAPIYGDGTSKQTEAENKALQLLREKEIFYFYHDLTDSYKALEDYDATPWANGQMASVLRTPLFYYHAAMLQEQGYKSIVVGTTNRDEGSYIGFFGKASDAMVDLQPIADIHKSEVYQVAHKLGVTKEIIEAVPSGDVWDGRVDEEMIGSPYWFLEYYLLNKCSKVFNDDNLSYNEIYRHNKFAENIEELHNKNKHKYQVGNPAHFIDVMERKVPGGWN